jgi:hypothetical protein
LAALGPRLSRIPGIALEAASISSSARTDALRHVEATLRQIHAIDQTAIHRSGLVPGDEHPGDLERRLVGTFDELRHDLASAPSALGAITSTTSRPAAWRTFRRTSLRSRCIRPGSEHCFIDPSTGAFIGLIDFGDAYRSHPALDVRSWRSPDDSQHLLEGYTSSRLSSKGFLKVTRLRPAFDQPGPDVFEDGCKPRSSERASPADPPPGPSPRPRRTGGATS